ncbi:MAG: phosphatidate cytidylyltransferase [Chloroflexota bacterium]|nr:phosphatidate cytidylyltransferase [Chloroflexota bacterium]
MRERAISAVVIAVVVIVFFLLGQPWLTFGIAALALLAAVEVFRLLPPAGFPVRLLPGVLFPPIAVLGMGWDELAQGFIAVYVAVVLIVLAIDAFRRPEVRDGFLVWMGGSFGALYPSMLAFMAAILVAAPDVPEDALLGGLFSAGQTWLLVLVLTVWSFDTFAYLSGRTFKKGRFLNHISPNKTWSGVIGGTVAAVIVGGVLAWAAGQGLPGGMLMGLFVAIAGQAGDVAESMLKRTAGAKDSSNLIPGHGGILDRTDSFLFAAPVVYAYLLVVGV